MSKTKSLSFDIFAQAGPSRTSAYALLFEGQEAGRIITAWPSNGAGCVRMACHFWQGPLKHDESMLGQAGGWYGYDKESVAFADALDRAGKSQGADLAGLKRMGAVTSWLESQGYRVIKVL